jgi:hypothetical protein
MLQSAPTREYDYSRDFLAAYDCTIKKGSTWNHVGPTLRGVSLVSSENYNQNLIAEQM